MFIFIRQDLPIAQQIVQSNHATQKLFSTLPCEGTPNMVAIGVPDIAAMNRVLLKLKQNQISHFAWSEPDFDLGLTAIVTVPLDEERKKVLSNYRVYNAGVGGRLPSGESRDSRTNSPVVSTPERSALNREVRVQILPGEPAPL